MRHAAIRLWRNRGIGVLAVGALLLPVGSALAQTPAKAVTFAKDVAPILQDKCQTCHRPGQMGPMSLLTYEDARPWARAIRTKVVARDMPPWHLDKTVGISKFKNDASLSDAQIDTIAKWVDAGAPLGDPKDLPAPRQWPNDAVWQLTGQYGQPDLVIKSTPWTQAAQGQDEWYQPIVDSGLTEDRWVRAIEVSPSAKGRRVVHHALAYLMQQEDPNDKGAVAGSGGEAMFIEFSVGKFGEIYHENTGKLMKAGAKIRYDIHYHSVGEAITDQTEIAVYFYPKGVVPKYRVYATPMGVQDAMRTLDIPPGLVTVHHGYFAMNQPGRLENFQPHMHVRGKAMSMEAIYPDGRTELLNYVDHFNFNWHVNYVYADDVAPVLPKGTIIHITAWHDNTPGNKANPDATQWIGWGQRSFDDMYHAHVNVTYLTDEDYKQITEERKKARSSATATGALQQQ